MSSSNHSQQIVQKLWNYCNILRDDGLSYGDYVEQLTFLLFLKMAHEQTLPPWNRASPIPTGYDWPGLMARDGDALETHYRHILSELGRGAGLIPTIFRGSSGIHVVDKVNARLGVVKRRASRSSHNL